jgi:hypothetical protein
MLRNIAHIHAYSWLKNLPQVASVTLFLIQSLVKQMVGLYKVKSPLLLPLVIQIKAAEGFGVAVNYRHVLMKIRKLIYSLIRR